MAARARGLSSVTSPITHIVGPDARRVGVEGAVGAEIVSVEHLIKRAEGGDLIARIEERGKVGVVRLVHTLRSEVGQADVEEEGAKAGELGWGVEGAIADRNALEVDVLRGRRVRVALMDRVSGRRHVLARVTLAGDKEVVAAQVWEELHELANSLI